MRNPNQGKRSIRISESAWEVLNNNKQQYGIPITQQIDLLLKKNKYKLPNRFKEEEDGTF